MRKRLKNSESSEHLTHRVPFSQKAYFGISIAGVSFIQSMIDGSMLKYYTDFILFPSFLFGVVQLIFGVWNALNDPLIGYYSDKILLTKKRITRKMWLYISIPFVSLGYFSIILVNPEIPTALIFTILLIGLSIQDTGSAIFNINRSSLLVSITSEDSERSSLVVMSLIFQTILGIFTYILPLLFLIEDTPLWILYLMFSFVGIIGMGISFLGIKGIQEPLNLYKENTFIRFKSMLKDMFKLKSLTFFLFISFLINAVAATTLTFQLFYFQYVAKITGLKATLASAIALPVTFGAYFLMQICSKRIGPRRSLLLFILISITGYLGLLFFTEYLFIIILYIMVLMGNSAYWIYSMPIYGNIIDEFESKMGKRNEGTFMGIRAIFESPSKSVMIFLFTVIITSMGYLGGQEQVPSAILGIKIGVSILPIIFLLSGFFFLWFFPLKGKKLEQLKKVSRKLYDERLG